jgi:hypothetical protein
MDVDIENEVKISENSDNLSEKDNNRVDSVQIKIGDKSFTLTTKELVRSEVLKMRLDDSVTKEIIVEEDSQLFKHIIYRLKCDDYMFPIKIKDELEILREKYKISKGFRHRKINVLGDKALLYINKFGSIDKAFFQAKHEDSSTLNQIYREGVDINFDVDTPNKLNMFNWSVTAHGVCNPYFLEMMFLYNREDIKVDGQHVFEFSCQYGDTRHIDVFMRRYVEYKWDIFKGMKAATRGNNFANLHHLNFYYHSSPENIIELWDLAFISQSTKIVTYITIMTDIKVTEEDLMRNIRDSFLDMLVVILNTYLDQGGKRFKITRDIVDYILSRTDDRFYKLEYLKGHGFEVEDLGEIKSMKETDLPKCSAKRYIQLI